MTGDLALVDLAFLGLGDDRVGQLARVLGAGGVDAASANVARRGLPPCDRTHPDRALPDLRETANHAPLSWGLAV